MLNSKSTKKIIPAILSLSLLGLIVSVLIIRIHYQISLNPGEKSFCYFSDMFDCEAILASPYAKLGPFFNAELAFGYYLILIWGLVESWGKKKPLPALSYVFTWTIFAAIYSVTLNLLSTVKLGVICPLGLITTIINLIVLVLLPLEMKVPLPQLPNTIKKKLFLAPKSLLFYGVGTLIIFGMGLLFARKLNPQARYSFGISPEAYLKSFYALPQKEIPLPERPIRGSPDASVTILVFSDFRSTACRRAESTLKPVLEQYRDRIRQIYLNYPLNSSCNPMVRQTKYPMACIDSKAALCAYQQGKFWEYHDWVFQNRSIDYESLADALEMERSSFENCVISEKTAKLLKEDIAAATQFKVDRIPTLYINGRQFRDWSNAERLRLVLESELSQTALH